MKLCSIRDIEFQEDEELKVSLAREDPGGFSFNNFEGQKCKFESDEEFGDYLTGLAN